jgi:hypothetical protein
VASVGSWELRGRSGCCRSPAPGELTLTADKLSFAPAFHRWSERQQWIAQQSL